jgi:hypothetical protein
MLEELEINECEKNSLIATIKEVRPDVLKDVAITASPIPIQMPSSFQQPIEFIQDIGEPINACFLSRDNVDPSGWFVVSLFLCFCL